MSIAPIITSMSLNVKISSSTSTISSRAIPYCKPEHPPPATYILNFKQSELIEKDNNRAFSELERIIIYRKGKGFCQQCLREGKPESESKVSWTNYQADHVLPHSKGGKTIIENGELLCSYHNLSKGNRN